MAASRSYSRASRRPRAFSGCCMKGSSFVPSSRLSFSRGRSPRRSPPPTSSTARDDRDSLLELGPALGLSPDEIDRIRKVSGYVGCFLPTPVGRLRRAVHHQPPDPHRRPHLLRRNPASGGPTASSRRRASRRSRSTSWSTRRSSEPNPPKAGSNYDFAIVPLAEPIDGVEPFPVDAGRQGEERRRPDRHHRPSRRHGEAVAERSAGGAGLHGPPRAGLDQHHLVLPHRLRRDRARRPAACTCRGSTGELVYRGVTITTGPVARPEASRARPMTRSGAASPRRSAPTRPSSRRDGRSRSSTGFWTERASRRGAQKQQSRASRPWRARPDIATTLPQQTFRSA